MDESFRPLLKYFTIPNPEPGEIKLVILIILVFFALLFLLVYLQAWLKSRKERANLIKAARKHNLSQAENDLISSLSKGKSRIKPGLVFVSIGEFHRLFGPLMHELVEKAEHDEAAHKKLDGIFALRKKLFGEVAYHFGSITSTIQFRIGQKLTLQFSIEGVTREFSSMVLDVDAAAITVANASENGKFFHFGLGQQFKVSFNRVDDGFYEFETTALRSVTDKNEYFLLLAHATQLKRLQSRMYYRVRLDKPFSFRRFAWDESLETRYHPGSGDLREKFNGEILNLGGGGMLIFTGENLVKNDLLTFDLELNAENTIHDLLAKVVGIEDEEELGIKRKLIHLQFMNIKPGEQDLITKLIQQSKLPQ